MITKQERIEISKLIEAKQVALSEFNQADFASEVKAHAAFAYVRASDELEAYLDSLVTSEGTTAANAGWIEWSGGRCPVEAETLVEVKWADGDLIINKARVFGWNHFQVPEDIVAYRVV